MDHSEAKSRKSAPVSAAQTDFLLQCLERFPTLHCTWRSRRENVHFQKLWDHVGDALNKIKPGATKLGSAWLRHWVTYKSALRNRYPQFRHSWLGEVPANAKPKLRRALRLLAEMERNSSNFQMQNLDTNSMKPTTEDNENLDSSQSETSLAKNGTSDLIPTQQEASQVMPTKQGTCEVIPTKQNACQLMPTTEDFSRLVPKQQDVQATSTRQVIEVSLDPNDDQNDDHLLDDNLDDRDKWEDDDDDRCDNDDDNKCTRNGVDGSFKLEMETKRNYQETKERIQIELLKFNLKRQREMHELEITQMKEMHRLEMDLLHWKKKKLLLHCDVLRKEVIK